MNAVHSSQYSTENLLVKASVVVSIVSYCKQGRRGDELHSALPDLVTPKGLPVQSPPKGRITGRGAKIRTPLHPEIGSILEKQLISSSFRPSYIGLVVTSRFLDS
jgi:hypothetical protein